MAYEWVPTALVGILILVVGLRIQGRGIFGLARLALTIGGIILIGWAIFAGWDELSLMIYFTNIL